MKLTVLMAAALLTSNLWAAPEPKGSAGSGNKAILQKVYDAFNTNDTTALEKLVDTNVVSHDLPAGVSPGLKGSQEMVVILHRAFPDFKIRVDEMMAEGDRVAARIYFTGSHEGEFLGIPRTSKRVSYTGIHWAKFYKGKVVELWSFMDHDQLRAQLADPNTPLAGSKPK